jgi:hypothetical protein
MFADVTPGALRRELLRLGFTEYETEGRAGVTWASESLADGPTVVVPREEDAELRGYAETIDSALQRLSWITGEKTTAIAARLIGGPDRIEMRILHPVTDAHTVPLLKASTVMESFVNLIKQGARARFSGTRASHRGPGGEDYDSALANIQVLAPAPGSFRLIAVSAEAPQLAVMPADSSKARDALAATLYSVQALGAESRSAPELEDTEVERLVDSGVSTGVLAAVEGLAISDTSGLALEFMGRWDTTTAVPDAPTGTVVLRDAHVSLAHGLRERLGAYEPESDFRLDGWVQGTSAPGQSLEGFPEGTVTVRTRHKGRDRDVLVGLPKGFFGQVTAGFSEVRATGTLERFSGRWHLLTPRDIEVTEPKSQMPSRSTNLRLQDQPSDDAEPKQIEPDGSSDK